MSRKDRRRVLVLTVGGDLLAAANAARRPGRSLADVLRRWIQAASEQPFVDLAQEAAPTGRRLPVQLPADLRQRLGQAAAQTGQPPAYCALQDLHAFLRAHPVAQAPHAAPDPDQRRCSDP